MQGRCVDYGVDNGSSETVGIDSGDGVTTSGVGVASSGVDDISGVGVSTGDTSAELLAG